MRSPPTKSSKKSKKVGPRPTLDLDFGDLPRSPLSDYLLNVLVRPLALKTMILTVCQSSGRGHAVDDLAFQKFWVSQAGFFQRVWTLEKIVSQPRPTLRELSLAGT